MKLEIRKYPDPILLKKAEKIKNPLADDIQGLIFQMIETLRDSKGVGLAAPQVGVSLRLFVVELEGKTYVLINPKITSTSRKKEICEEGCLSFPGKFLPVPRYEEVQIRFTDEYGKPGKIKAHGLLARAFQHELDHLDGILLIDRSKKSPQKKTEEKVQAKEKKLSVVFMGTSELSGIILESLIEKYTVIGVFTKPDVKIGRQHEESSPIVKKMAKERKIPVFQPNKFDEEAIKNLKKLSPDIVIVAAYGKIIPQKALDIPKFGFINVHVSLLPKYRGPSPIQNALINGENETGVTIMLMDKGVDTGDILSQEIMPIEPDDNQKNLTEKLSHLGAKMLLETISLWIQKKIKPKPQDHNSATLCQLIEREDGRVYWTSSAQSIYNRYRALTPWPGIFTYWKNNSKNMRLKLISIALQKSDCLQKHKEGEVFEIGDDIGVQTGSGVIILKEIQKEGKNKMKAKDFVNGYPGFTGSILQ